MKDLPIFWYFLCIFLEFPLQKMTPRRRGVKWPPFDLKNFLATFHNICLQNKNSNSKPKIKCKFETLYCLLCSLIKLGTGPWQISNTGPKVILNRDFNRTIQNSKLTWCGVMPQVIQNFQTARRRTAKVGGSSSPEKSGSLILKSFFPVIFPKKGFAP